MLTLKNTGKEKLARKKARLQVLQQVTLACFVLDAHFLASFSNHEMK